MPMVRISRASTRIGCALALLGATTIAYSDDAMPIGADAEAGRLVAQAPPGEKTRDARDRADVLLDDDLPSEDAPTGIGLHGYDQFEAAYTYPAPGHWSKLLNRFELDAQGQFSSVFKWRAGVRLDYDAIYSLSHFYPDDVRRNQRFDPEVRETFIDYGAGDFDFRVGRQQIVWGEVVGLFFADVVSAKDLRQFVLPDFEQIRIPQYAARAEYFRGDTHLEAIWIPFPTVDQIGKPGSNFYPYPPSAPGYGYVIQTEQKPHGAGQENVGARLSTLIAGYDMALFAYNSVNAAPTFYRSIVYAPNPTLVYTPKHDRITQYGFTVAKDFSDFVVKSEVVYAVGTNFNTTSLADADGVVKQNYLDYIISAEWPLPNDARFNLQFFERRYNDHDPGILPSAREDGVSVFLSGKIGDHFAPEILAIRSLNRSDWMVRPRLVWNFAKDWRAAFGVDVFGGRPTGLFGEFNNQDRVYAEVRRSF